MSDFKMIDGGVIEYVKYKVQIEFSCHLGLVYIQNMISHQYDHLYRINVGFTYDVFKC